MTVTVKLQPLELPAASVAVANTVVVPTAKLEPDAMLVTTVGTEQLSLAPTVNVTATQDDVSPLLGSRINAEAEPDKSSVIGQGVQYPRRPHRLDVQGKREPPPNATLVAIRGGVFVEELGRYAALNAECLYKVMNIKSL